MGAADRPGWSVMGTGTIATEHMVEAIRLAGHEPKWVVSRNSEYAHFFSVDMDIPNKAIDAGRALRDPNVNYVYVSAGVARRKHYVTRSISVGKHVLSDGPLSSNSRTAEVLASRAALAGLTLAINEPARASTIHQTMRRLLAEGEIGALQSILIVRGGPFQPRMDRRSDTAGDDGDICAEVTVQDIDLARFLSDQEPVAVTCTPFELDHTPPQQMAYSIQLSGGALCQAFESFQTSDLESLVLLAGDNGTLIAHGTLNFRGIGTLVRRIAGRNELIPVRERDPHRTTIDEFIASVRRGPTWLGDGTDNAKALKTVEALVASSRRRKTIYV